MAADPNGSDVCKAIAALYNLKRLTPAFTFALQNVNDAKKQDMYMWGSITLAGIVVVGGAALFAFPATVAPLWTGATIKGTATVTAAGVGTASTVNTTAVTAGAGGATAGSALVTNAAAGGALATNVAAGGAAAAAAAAVTTATAGAGPGSFAARALLAAGITGAGGLSLKSWLELAETREG